MTFPPNTTYATVDEFKQRAAAEAAVNTVTDAIAQQLLNDAAYMVDSLTRGARAGYEAFSASTSETRLFDDDLLPSGGYITIDDAVTVTALSIGGTAVTSTYYKTWPYNTGQGPITRILIARDAPLTVTTASDRWYRYPNPYAGAGQVAVTGTWGYCTNTTSTRPAIVKEATLQMAILMYKQNGVGMSEVLQMLQTNPTKFLTAHIADRLRALRRPREVYVA